MLYYDMYSANKSHGNYVPDLRKSDFEFKKNKYLGTYRKFFPKM